MNDFARAVDFAARIHAGQVRKGSGAPYLSHVLGAASIALEHGADETEAIAALLHDAVEDGPSGTLSQIEQEFGLKVAGIVIACTDARLIGAARDAPRRAPWRTRKEAWIATIPSLSKSARLVALSDKLHNARTILTDYRWHGETIWERFAGKRDGTLWYYRELSDAFIAFGPGQLAWEFKRAVEEIERLARVA